MNAHWLYHTRFQFTLALSIFLFVACSSDDDAPASTTTQALVGTAKTGASPPEKMRTVKPTPELVARGKEKFMVCTACHGEQGEGKIGQGPRLNSASFLSAASDAFLTHTIKHGRAGTTMVSWAETLNDQDIQAIVAYLRSLNQSEPAKLDEKPLSGDAKAGEEIFTSVCAACHGRTGAGYLETANGTGIGRAPFLASVTNGFLRYMIKNGKDQTQMRPFEGKNPVAVSNLTDKQIEDVIAYLRANAW